MKQSSFSGLFNFLEPISEIEKKIMQPYADFANELSESLENDFLLDLKSDNEKINEMMEIIFNEIKSQNDKIIKFESLCQNSQWKGYIDIITDNCFYEMKIRSNHKLDKKFVLQCEMYKRLSKIQNYKILIFNRNDNTIKIYNQDNKHTIGANKVLDKAFELKELFYDKKTSNNN